MQERREYFRIDDTVSLKYRVIQTQDAEDEMHKARQGYAQLAELKSALACIDARLDDIQTQLHQTNPLVADMLDILNKKIAIHEKLLGFEEYNDNVLSPAQHVNISGSGVAFEAQTPINEGTYLKLEMITYPEQTFIPAYATVVFCKKSDKTSAAGYRIAVKYSVITDEDRERLVNHIFRKQSDQLRQQRQEQQKTGTED